MIQLINPLILTCSTLLSFLLPRILRKFLRVSLLITLLFHSLVGIQLITVLLQQSYKTLSPMLQGILYLITLYINISQLNILSFLVISDEIFMRQTHRMNGSRLYIMSCKPLIKITRGVLSNSLKINMLWEVVGCIKSSLTQMDSLTDTRRALWLKAILKPLA